MSKPLSLRPPEEIERIGRGMEEFVQTLRARAKRIDQARALLATLTADERLGLFCESLGISDDELFRMVESVVPAAPAPTTQRPEE